MSRTFKLQNKDILLSPTGAPILIADSDKLLQDFSNIIQIPLGFHFAHPELGTRINSFVGLPIAPEGLKGLTENELNNAVSQLESLQYIQSKYQSITLEEAIAEIRNLEITNTTFNSVSFICEVYSRSGVERRLNETIQ